MSQVDTNDVDKQYDALIREALESAKYRHSAQTRDEMIEVLATYPGLKPVTDTHVFNDGTEQLLVALSGTIPINFTGSVYNIPIAIWLLDTHPYNAPMVFVKPTPVMRIKVSDYVNPDGKVRLPYLQEWKPGSSELLLLIQILIIAFQDDPPVYAVQATTPPYPHLGSPPTNSTYSYPSPPGPVSPRRQEELDYATIKLREKLEAVFLSTESEKKMGLRLTQGNEMLSVMMKRAEDERVILQDTVDACQSELSQLDKKIEILQKDLDNRASSIEEAVQAPKPLYKQMVNAYAEDAALEDAIYFVGEGFRSGKMDLDQFEKSIRKLARKQFMIRLLLQKCRKTAGLPT